MLYADRDLGEVTAALEGDPAWSLKLGDGAAGRRVSRAMRRHDFLPLHLLGPADLPGKDAVRVTVAARAHRVTLRIDAAARVEPRRGLGPGLVEPRRVDGHAAARARFRIPMSLERRAGMNQGEIDVEEDGSGVHEGLATTIEARAGSRTEAAAALTSSIVTDCSSDGSLRS
jgi:hypothetical protein